MHSHASRRHRDDYCHFCKVDFVLLHDIMCYTNSLLSRIRFKHCKLVIKCTLVATKCALLAFWLLNQIGVA